MSLCVSVAEYMYSYPVFSKHVGRKNGMRVGAVGKDRVHWGGTGEGLEFSGEALGGDWDHWGRNWDGTRGSGRDWDWDWENWGRIGLHRGGMLGRDGGHWVTLGEVERDWDESGGIGVALGAPVALAGCWRNWEGSRQGLRGNWELV